jgi:uncharacterized membrane protein
MSYSKTPIVLAIILLLFATVIALPVSAEQEGASTAIYSAKNTIEKCYEVAKEAEAACANITGIIATLNEAGELLSQAELAYAASDFDAARNLAVQSQNTLNNFIGEANTLKETALQQQNQDFLIDVLGSIIGTFAVIFAGGVVWLLLKKKYKTTEADVSESEGV